MDNVPHPRLTANGMFRAAQHSAALGNGAPSGKRARHWALLFITVMKKSAHPRWEPAGRAKDVGGKARTRDTA